MAATYGDLKTQVATWLNRADLTANIPLYIGAALDRINLELQSVGGIIDQEQVAFALTPINTYSNLQNDTYQDSLLVPSDYQALRYIKVVVNNSGIPDIEEDVLETVPYDQLIDVYGSQVLGPPQQVAIFNGSFFFRPVPDLAYRIQIGYIKRYTDFASDGDTNWLLTNGGNVVLYAACLEAAPQLRDDQRLQSWGGQYKEAMRIIVAANKRAERGPKPAGSRVESYLIRSSNEFSIING